MDETTRIFSQRLKQKMEQRNISFRQLEKMTGIPFNSLNDYVNCKSAIPLPRAKKIADALDLDIDWLAGRIL